MFSQLSRKIIILSTKESTQVAIDGFGDYLGLGFEVTFGFTPPKMDGYSVGFPSCFTTEKLVKKCGELPTKGGHFMKPTPRIQAFSEKSPLTNDQLDLHRFA